VTTETKKQIIHRDIKPANILYHKNSDSYKLGDFGVSKELDVADSNLTRSIGTCNYMAPEVINSRFYDFRADIYSLGLVLYCLANKKRLPFVKEVGRYKDEHEAFERRIAGEQLPPPESISPPLAKVILKACAYKPEDRYSSAKEFRLALEAVIAKTPLQEKPQPEVISQETVVPVPVVGEFGPKKRKWKGFVIGLICLVVLIIGLSFASDILPFGQTEYTDET
jgi:serine/threonine-protein kinase